MSPTFPSCTARSHTHASPLAPDRCGALHIGDHILGIDDVSVDRLSVKEATQLLKSASAEHIKLEILPVTQLRGKSATISSISTSSSRNGSGHMAGESGKDFVDSEWVS